MTEEEFAGEYFASQMGFNVDEYMEKVIDNLIPYKVLFEETVAERVKELNNTCECCKEKPIERYYKIGRAHV